MKTATFVKKVAMLLVWFDWFFVFALVGAFVFLFSLPFQSEGSFHNQLWAATALGGTTFLLLSAFYLNGLILRLLLNEKNNDEEKNSEKPLSEGTDL